MSAVLDTALLKGTSLSTKILSSSTIFLRNGTFEENVNSFNYYLNNLSPDERSNIRCVTFTMNPSHWKLFKPRIGIGFTPEDIFMHYLDLKHVRGCFVIELTKRGVPHVHGISPNVYDRDANFWGAQCKVKCIMDKGIQGWFIYCSKDKISAETNSLFFDSDKAPPLDVYTSSDFKKLFSKEIL